MRKSLCLLTLLISFAAFSQSAKKNQKEEPKNNVPKKEKKYPSLLWEITGNGLTQPSYLFGTMHISNKMVFHLGDSFYNAIKSVDVVALEQDPDLWQEEYSKRSKNNNPYNFSSYYRIQQRPSDRLTINTLAVKDYTERLKAILPLEARMVNGMMYRTDPYMEDFQENTYLDMYIYQTGRRLNKILTGVENGKETDKLVKKAYGFDQREILQRKSYSAKDNFIGYKKSEEAYRTGDLDLMDSIEMANVISEEYQEYFMFKRNEIQAHSIDTIVKKHSLFVGVGAAHLPGPRGVIELLRKMGYTVRPVTMSERNSEEKERLEKTRVPVKFTEHWSEDSSFSLKIPGNKLYEYPVFSGVEMKQYADMANGSYYIVSRLRTNASLLGHKPETVLRKIDSLLYENIPGKIITQKQIEQNGYKGLEIINKTKKGDAQHYHIFVLPDEVVILKAAGVGDYILNDAEAETFLSSIQFQTPAVTKPISYKPPFGGFTVSFPKKPAYVPKENSGKNRQEWSVVDDNGNTYAIFKTNLHHYDYIEEDTFDLRLAEESFANSSFISKKLKREFTQLQKYPALKTEYQHQDGSSVKAMFVVRGNDYYVLTTKSNKSKTLLPFFESFSFTDFEYPSAIKRIDSTLGFTVKSPLWYPEKADDDDADYSYLYYLLRDQEDESGGYLDRLNMFKSATVGNDTTGEHISVFRYVQPEYSYWKDTSKFMKYYYYDNVSDSDYVVHKKKEWTTNTGWKVLEYEVRDTASSRSIIGRNFYKEGVAFQLQHMKDTLSKPSSFIETFFSTFTPADTFRFVNPFAKNTDKLFAAYFGTDTVAQKKARGKISAVTFDSSDLPMIKRAIGELNWSSKKYLATKQKWISALGDLKDSASVDYLAELYKQAKDTSDLQNEVLDALASMKTAYAFNTFKKLMLNDPPALVSGNSGYYSRNYDNDYVVATTSVSDDYYTTYRRGYGHWSPLYDTLSLTASILPDFTDLMALDDYKDAVMQLLVTSVDSGYLKPSQYKQFYNRFLLEGKQVLKKQFATEDRKSIQKASQADETRNYGYYSNEEDYGNSRLIDYAVLLMPFWDNEEVRSFFDKLLQTKDKRLRCDAVMLLLRNKKPVNDTLLTALAANDSYRLRLYNELEKAKLLEKFPTGNIKQEDFARSMLMRNNYRKPDSIFFLQKQMITLKGTKGWVYFYKYKRMKDDVKWNIAVSGLQPFEQDKVTAKFNDYSRVIIEFTDEQYVDEQTLPSQLEKVIKELTFSKRSSGRMFYIDKDNDIYESVLSERVKQTRYD